MRLKRNVFRSVAVCSMLSLAGCGANASEGLSTLYGDVETRMTLDTALSNLEDYIARTYPISDEELSHKTEAVNVTGMHDTAIEGRRSIRGRILSNSDDESVLVHLRLNYFADSEAESKVTSGELFDQYTDQYGQPSCSRGKSHIWLLDGEQTMIPLEKDYDDYVIQMAACKDVAESAQNVATKRVEVGRFGDGFDDHIQVMRELAYVIVAEFDGNEDEPLENVEVGYIDVSKEIEGALSAYDSQ